MPLRDHFHSPLDDHFSWEGLHGGWPMVLVQHLSKHLPDGFAAEPRVHLGTHIEVDIGTFEHDDESTTYEGSEGNGIAVEGSEGNGIAVAWAPTKPALSVETDLGEPSEYEVLVYNTQRSRRLVAAVEIVSPANKDRPEHRRAFVAKCAALLQKQVCVAIVDIVTVPQFNLYADLMAMIDRTDPALTDAPTAIYAVTCRSHKSRRRSLLDTWFDPLTLGEQLPTLPLWLSKDLAVPLELEASYEDTCRTLRIR